MAAERFFELVLLPSQQPVQAGWVAVADMKATHAARAVLSAGPQGHAPLPLADATMRWTFAPQLGITTIYVRKQVALVSLLVGEPGEPGLAKAWLDNLRATKPVQELNQGDPEAFEIFRRMRERPLCASVLFPTPSRDECKAVVDFHRAVAALLFTADWGGRPAA